MVTRAVEVLAGKRGEREARLDALADADGVALERVNRQPQRREITDAERRRRGIEHLADDRAPLDHDA